MSLINHLSQIKRRLIFNIARIAEHPDYASISLAFTALTAGDHELVLETIGAAVTENPTVTTETPGFAVFTYTPVSASTYVNDVIAKLDTKSFSTLESKATFSVTFDLTCSSGGANTLTYGLSEYNGGTVPSWVTFDSVNSKLTGTAPVVTTQSTFSFYIDTTSTSFTGAKKKLINLTVAPPAPSTSQPAAESKNEPVEESFSEEAKAMSILTQVVVSIGIAVSVAKAFLNCSNPTMVWSIINQLQLLMFLLLVDSYLPYDVQEYIRNQGFALFDFSFIPIVDIPYIGFPPEWTDFEQANEILQDLGVESRSTFNNCFSLIVIVLLTLFANIIL